MTRTPMLMLLTVGTLAACLDPARGAEPRARTLRLDAERRAWVDVVPPQPGTPTGDLALIREHLTQKRYGKALAEIRRFEKQYGTGHALHPAILVATAQARIGRQDYDAAHKTLRAFLDRYVGTEPTQEALRQLFVVAEAYLGGAKRRVLGLPVLSGVDVAYDILDEISVDHAEDPLAPLAIKTKADHLFSVGDYDLAEFEYTRLLQEYPATRYHQYALRRTADAALASYGGVPYDDASLIEAGQRYEEYRLRYPVAADHEGIGLILENVRTRLADKQFAIGQYYERTRHIASAVHYYGLVCERFAGTVAAGRAADRLELLGARPAAPRVEEDGAERAGEASP